MKRTGLTTLLVLLFGFGVAQGAIYIDWTSGAIPAIYFGDGTTPLTQDRVFAGYLTSNGDTSGFDGTTTGWDNPTGGDTFIGYWDLGNAVDGAIISVVEQGPDPSAGWGVGSNVYIAVFDITPAGLVSAGGDMPLGTAYGLSGVSAGTTTEYNTGGAPPAPQGLGAQLGTTVADQSISAAAIPEPGTVSLLLIGGAVLAGRATRRRKK